MTRPTRAQAVDAAVLLVSAGVLLAWFRYALALVVDASDFEFVQGEGLSIDYARRLLSAPGTLYPPDTAVPYPLVYTPLFSVLLVPFQGSFAGARFLAVLIAISAGVATYLLARRKAPPPLALAAVALVFAPFEHSCWYAIARVDGLLVALFLWSAVVGLPERGASLSWGRALVTAVLLNLAVLAKPTGAIYGAPIVLGWWFVDRRSCVRLLVTAGGLGVAVFVGLQVATGGGFWTAQRLQLLHRAMEGQTARLMWGALIHHWPAMLVWLAAGLVAWRRKDGSLADASLLLWLSGPLTIPLLSKSGAIFNYVLPWSAGQAVLVSRWFSNRAGGVACAAAALVMALTQTFPLPTEADRETALDLYALVRERGAPLLAAGPDAAYLATGESVRIEGASFPYLMKGKAPGIDGVLEDLRAGRFRTLLEPPAGRFGVDAYRAVAQCTLGFFNGQHTYKVYVPVAEAPAFAFEWSPLSRCTSLPR